MSTPEPLPELLARFPFLTERAGSADATPAVNVPAPELARFATALRDEFGFASLADIAGCDWGADAAPRFSAIYHFRRIEPPAVLRAACDATGDDDAPELPSLAALFPSANWLEREVFDMFGIRFAGHPDPRRILMWDGYPHHPLRKDFPLGGVETPLPKPDRTPDAKTRIAPAPLEGGPFVAAQPRC